MKAANTFWPFVLWGVMRLCIVVVGSRVPRRRDPMSAASPRERRRAAVRLALGLAQMMGATGAATLVLTTGMNPWSLTMVMGTCALTAVSVLLVGSRRQQCP